MKTVGPSLILLVLLLGFGSGYWLRVRKSASKEMKADDQAGHVTPSRATRRISRTTPLAAQLQSHLDLANGQEYWLEWIAGIEGAALNDFPKMAQIAAANPTALRILALRWLELDPAHLFKTLSANSPQLLDSPDRIDENTSRELYLLLFQEWPKTDPEAAFSALFGDAKIPGYRQMQWELLNSLAEADPLRALELMRERGSITYGVESTKISEWIERDPRAAVDAIIANSIGHVSYKLLDAAARIWTKSDPLVAMELARSTEGKLGRVFRQGAFAGWLEKDLESAANWLADQESVPLQDELRPAVIKQWAEKDPEGALEWTNANLQGRHQARAMVELIATVAAKDRDLAVQFFDKIAPGAARNEAARIIAKELFSSLPPGGTSSKGGHPAITWLKKLKPDAREAALMQVGHQWASTNPESLKTYLLSDPTIPEYHLGHAAVMLAQKKPAATMEWSKEFPPRQQTTIAKGAFQSWLRNHPINATKWFDNLPKNDSQRPPMVEVYLEGFKYLKEDIAAERLRMLPKEDWKTLDQLDLPAEKIERIKKLAEK